MFSFLLFFLLKTGVSDTDFGENPSSDDYNEDFNEDDYYNDNSFGNNDDSQYTPKNYVILNVWPKEIPEHGGETVYVRLEQKVPANSYIQVKGVSINDVKKVNDTTVSFESPPLPVGLVEVTYSSNLIEWSNPFFVDVVVKKMYVTLILFFFLYIGLILGILAILLRVKKVSQPKTVTEKAETPKEPQAFKDHDN